MFFLNAFLLTICTCYDKYNVNHLYSIKHNNKKCILHIIFSNMKSTTSNCLTILICMNVVAIVMVG